MGCNQSQADASTSPDTRLATTATANGTSRHNTDAQRARSDTLDGSGGRTAQWKRLLSTVPIVADPADVPSVLDTLLAGPANRVPAVQVQWLRNSIVRTLGPPAKKTSFTGGGNAARALVEKQHLVPPTVLRRVFPPSPLQEAWIHLCQQWTYLLEPSVATALAAVQVENPVPRELAACIHRMEGTPDGASLLSVTALLGLGLYGSREHQLALLFAVLRYSSSSNSSNANDEFADTMPLALLEMQAGVALSRASLVHYHTHGWTTLPTSLSTNHSNEDILVSTKSAATIRRSHAVQLLQQAVAGHTWESPEESVADGAGGSFIATSVVSTTANGTHNTPVQSPLQVALENDVVKSTYVEWPDDKERWTLIDFVAWAQAALSDQAVIAALHNLLGRGLVPSPSLERDLVQHKQNPTVFGGLGNIDQRGGLGGGVRYCIPKAWWDAWDVYTNMQDRERPPSLTTDILLDPRHRGMGGSFEAMKSGLVRNRDYVLVSPAQWNTLYELYGGGPPLPRMVSPEGKLILYPWVLHVQLCDPLQPYRRGGENVVSIRCMSAADQPVWRLLGELVCRFQQLRVADSTGRMRLWKYVETTSKTTGKPIMSRFGPWNLLCKDRHATIPVASIEEDGWKDVIANWKEFSLDSTVESIGLKDEDSLLLEFAVVGKSGALVWPREAAAEEGRKRVVAEEDQQFRNMLQGLDNKGKPLLKPAPLVGREVDAADRAGRWYTAKILDAQIFDEDTDDEPLEEDDNMEVTDETATRKKVKVRFPNDHLEWIDVASDRLAIAGRMVSQREEGDTEPAKGQPGNGASTSASRSRNTPANGRSGSNAGESSNGENGKLCSYPGFGSCGLMNLGNTCYMNSAVQCIAYSPLLRSYLLSGEYKSTGDLNRDNPLGSGGKLLEEFSDLLRALWSAKMAEVRPVKFKMLLAKTNDQFSGGDQQDAQEFLTYMIDILHEDSNKVRKKPYVESMEDEWVASNPLAQVGDEAWRR